MSPLLAVTALLATVAIALLVTRQHRWVCVLGGLVLGSTGYFISGIQVARARGRGQFHSLPFGGIEGGDQEMLASVAVWVMGSILLLSLLLVTLRRSRATQS